MELLNDVEVTSALEGVQWQRDDTELVKVEKRADFVAAISFVNEVARLAELADHHPDIDIRWNTVTLRLSTHSHGGLTQKDFDLARQIDAIGA